jgi:hypothetical protein
MSNTKSGHRTGRDHGIALDFPKFSEKKLLPTSHITTMRFREPTNQFTAGKMSNMVWDHANQQTIVPAGVPGANSPLLRATNRSGRPFALDTFVGGSPDFQGVPLSYGGNFKMTE